MSKSSTNIFNWKIILDGPADAPANMSRDSRIFSCFEAGKIPPTFRIYSWSQPAVTYGYRFQKGQTPLDVFSMLDSLETSKGVSPLSISVRPTGGGIVFHQPGEITFAVVLPRNSSHYADNLLEPFFFTSDLILKFINSQGLKAEIKEKNFRGRKKLAHNLCFEEAAPFEIILNGQKILGLAQKRGRKSFFQQGTIKFSEPPADSPKIFFNYLAAL